MDRKVRMLLLVGSGFVLWLVPPFLCTSCNSTRVALTSTPPQQERAERISEAGVHYGFCAGVTLTVLLFPEPCDWERAKRNQALASR